MSFRSKPCTKVRHETRRLAEIHCRSVRIRTGQHLNPYVCTHCGKWHVGHNHKAPVYRILNQLDKQTPKKHL